MLFGDLEQDLMPVKISAASNSQYRGYKTISPSGYFQVGIVMDCHGVQSGHNFNMGIVTQNIANNSNIGNCEVLER